MPNFRSLHTYYSSRFDCRERLEFGCLKDERARGHGVPHEPRAVYFIHHGVSHRGRNSGKCYDGARPVAVGPYAALRRLMGDDLDNEKCDGDVEEEMD